MNQDLITLIVQIIAAFGVVSSVFYLGIQIHQQNKITKAQFGHSLTQRMYERYFNTSKDKEFSNFLSKDWAGEELDGADRWRVAVCSSIPSWWIFLILMKKFKMDLLINLT